jgi:hypothetical protein
LIPPEARHWRCIGRNPRKSPVACRLGNRYIGRARGKSQQHMRAETEKLVEDIKRSIGLLRRHL